MAELRRRAKRFLLPLPVRYRIASSAEWLSGITKNLSDSGILFATDGHLEIGAVIDMELAMEADGERWPSKIVAQASVVRVNTALASSDNAIAARFLEHQLLPRKLGHV